jgi:hypothetical protein
MSDMSDERLAKMRDLAQRSCDADAAMLQTRAYSREFYAAKKVAIAAIGDLFAECDPAFILALVDEVSLSRVSSSAVEDRA